MSAGHHHVHAFGLTGEGLDRILNSPEVRERLLRPRTINQENDMPYCGGYSTDGNTIYLDRHLPEELELELDGQTKLVHPAEFLAEYLGHEPVEWSVMDGLGWEYGPAHSGPATGSERRKVLRYLGPGWWRPWQTTIERYVKADEHEKLVKMPKDYDLRPLLYPPVNKALVAAVRRAMGVSGGKQEKSEVNYSEGHPSSHCGPVDKWPKGACVHYHEPNSCRLVRGFIQQRGWCKLWEGKNEGVR